MADFNSICLLLFTIWGCVLLCSGQNYGCYTQGQRGTTPHIKEIFLGRCYEYQNISPLSSCERSVKNCSKLLELFLKPFHGKDSCSFTEKDFDAYFDEVLITPKPNQTLFWSGTYSIAHTYSYVGRRFTTLEDILSGYLVNNLTWCGQKADPYLNYTMCEQCNNSLSSAYWSRASKQFALTAKGIVTVMLNGSIAGFRNDSFFGKFELPNLKKENVHTVRILLVYSLDKPKREKCSTGTIQILQQRIEGAGFAYKCEDDSIVIKYLLCADNPEARECLYITRLMSRSSSNQNTPILLRFMIIGLIFIFLISFPMD